MALDDAAFSGLVTQLLAVQAIVDAFPKIKRREVNVLLEEEFPLLAAWVEGEGESDQTGSDGEAEYEADYTFLVAAELGESEAQDAVLGRLLKVVKDAAAAMAVAGAAYEIGRWDADNNTAEEEGNKVWAEFGVTIRHYRPVADY